MLSPLPLSVRLEISDKCRGSETGYLVGAIGSVPTSRQVNEPNRQVRPTPDPLNPHDKHDRFRLCMSRTLPVSP